MKVSFDIFRKTYRNLKFLAYNGNCWSTKVRTVGT